MTSGKWVKVEVVFPGSTTPVEYLAEVVDGLVIVEGDMVLGTAAELLVAGPAEPDLETQPDPDDIQTMVLPLVADRSVKLWGGGLIPYTLDAAFSIEERQVIESAAQELTALTNLVLVPRTAETDYVHFERASNVCQAHVGRRGGKQGVWLSAGCLIGAGITIHEVLHAAGVKHEHSRPDRDAFVEILEDNILPGKEHNFKRLEPSGSKLLSVYDYGSVMHYPEWAFGLVWHPVNGSVWTIPQLAYKAGVAHGDFNGDGRTDLFRVADGKWWVCYGGTSGWAPLNQSNVPLTQLAFGHFDEDSTSTKTDVFRADGTHWWISKGGVGKWEELNTSSAPLSRLAFGDFTGNGRTDVFRADGTSWWLSENGRSKWTKIKDSAYTLDQIRVAHVSGSGRADIIRADAQNNWFVSRNTLTPGSFQFEDWEPLGGFSQLTALGVKMADMAFGRRQPSGRQEAFFRWKGSWRVGPRDWLTTIKALDGSHIGQRSGLSPLDVQGVNALYPRPVALRTYHGKYVVAEQNGEANANRTRAGRWERWQLIEHPDGPISLRGFHGSHLVAEQDGRARSDREQIGDWERWTLIEHNNGTVSLKSHHGQYLSAQANGGLSAGSETIGKRECFYIEPL